MPSDVPAASRFPFTAHSQETSVVGTTDLNYSPTCCSTSTRPVMNNFSNHRKNATQHIAPEAGFNSRLEACNVLSSGNFTPREVTWGLTQCDPSGLTQAHITPSPAVVHGDPFEFFTRNYDFANQTNNVTVDFQASPDAYPLMPNQSRENAQSLSIPSQIYREPHNNYVYAQSSGLQAIEGQHRAMSYTAPAGNQSSTEVDQTLLHLPSENMSPNTTSTASFDYSSTLGQEPDALMNSLPRHEWFYGEWSGDFNNVQDATNYIRKPRWKPAPGMQGVPVTDKQIERYAKMLYRAIVNFGGFTDRTKTKNKINRVVGRKYTQKGIEARCWEAVAEAIKLHREGALLMKCADPTYEPKVASKDTPPGEGDAGFKNKARAQQDRDLGFDRRMYELARTLKESKAAASDLLDGVKVKQLIYAPGAARRTKKENAINNQKKQKVLDGAKRNKDRDLSSFDAV